MKEVRSKIVIADDEPTNLLILEEILKDDYELFKAEDGTSAMSLVRKCAPDLILLDVMMPDLGGHEVCRMLKADIKTKHIPIIFISTLSEVYHETTGFSLGAVDYISKPIRPAIVKARVETHLSLVKYAELKRSRLQIIRSLCYAAEYKDSATRRRGIRMSHYSKILALALGYSLEEAEEFFTVAPLHDIGKIGIPDSILQKPTKLDEKEWKIMKRHPLIGAEIIGDHSSGLLKTARDMILSHHERWDGKGYPYGLSKNEIPPEGRLIAIVEVFDALTSKKAYKEAWTVEDAVSHLMAESGKHFDPEFVNHFLDKMPVIIEVMEKYKD
jgi:putative two-component system response regulator